MNNQGEWKILVHNIRGINTPEKWNSMRNRIVETKCDIICFQETKKDFFFVSLTFEISALENMMVSATIPQLSLLVA
jgi:exonuclease III